MPKNPQRRRRRRDNYNSNSLRHLPGRTQNQRYAQQCISDTLKHRQCKKRTAHTAECWIHLAKNKNLRIKPSTIPGAGKGLFAWKKPIQRNKKIDYYTGTKTCQRALDRKYGRHTTAEYSICNGPRFCIDAYKSTDAAPRFANDARGSRHRNNSDFTFHPRYNNFKLMSTKHIRPNSEIFAHYGDNYWPSSHRLTRGRR